MKPTTAQYNLLHDVVLEILRNNSELAAGVSLQTTIAELKFDSLERIDFSLELEDSLNCEIDDIWLEKECTGAMTVQELIDFIADGRIKFH
jgi:acyl carrier protein